jgi:hypothetical protein
MYLPAVLQLPHRLIPAVCSLGLRSKHDPAVRDRRLLPAVCEADVQQSRRAVGGHAAGVFELGYDSDPVWVYCLGGEAERDE